jgi:IclR family KDG regulon transcriptional repressor
MEKNETVHNYLLSSVKNALRILHFFTIDEPEHGIRELARKLNLSKSTIQRLMATLASEGFITKDIVTQKYRLGVSLLALSNVVTNHLEIHREALPILEQLVEKTGETAHVGILEGTKLVYLHIIESKRPIRIFTGIGKRIPCYCTGGGKAILAFQDEKMIEQVIQEGLIPYTKKTITDAEAFRYHLKEIKQNGYAVSIREFIDEEELVSIGAPIRDYTGKIFASTFIVGPAYRIKQKMIPDYAKEVMKAAMEISKKLGYINRRI